MPALKNDKKSVRKLYATFYSSVRTKNNSCFYCGAPRSCINHIPNLNLLVRSYDLDDLEKLNLKLVPSCGDCDFLLKDEMSTHLPDRLNTLYRKYNSVIMKTTDGWTNDEIKQLGPGLRKYIRASEEVRRVYLRKRDSIERRYLKHFADALKNENEWE